MTMTKAWAVRDYGAVDDLALIDLPVADPGAGEVLIDVEAMALNPLDLKIISGMMREMMPAPMPFVPGSDVVGTIIATGAGVGHITPGQRIVASTWTGALAQRALLPATAHWVVVPAEADAAALAALPMAGLTAINILRGLGNVSGKRLAVLGATGGVGLALVQLAAAAGATVIASAGAADAALVKANGAAEAVDYASQSFVDGLRQRYPDGVDMLVDLVSMFDALLASAAAVADGGILLSTLFGPDAAAFGDRITVIYSRLKAEPGDLAAIVERYLAGQFRANVGVTFGFDQARDAYLALRDHHVRGKIVVTRS